MLSVPKYNFNWQLAYELQTPLNLPAGSKLIITAHYDNSRNNKYNPAPDKEVFFREENQSWDEMFTPFIQYTVDSQDLIEPETPPTQARQNFLDIVEVGGCLEQGLDKTWRLSRANDPLVSKTQATSSELIRAAKARVLGNGQYQLLGVTTFNPSSYQGEKVAIMGVLIQDTKTSRLNVTSLQKLAANCF
jgi:hypothetical protein